MKRKREGVQTPKTKQTFFQKEIKDHIIQSEAKQNINRNKVEKFKEPGIKILKKLSGVFLIAFSIFFLVGRIMLDLGYFREFTYLAQLIRNIPGVIILIFAYLYISNYELEVFKYN